MELKDTKSIKLHPFMALSETLMECFCIIGYREKDLQKLSPNFIGDKPQIELSLISTIISHSSFKEYDYNMIIDKVYPDKPLILANTNNSKIKPSISSIIFSSCVKTNAKPNEPERTFYSGYALRFYELYEYNGCEYYVPKAFLIISQYPYFSQYHILCSFLYENFIVKKNDYTGDIKLIVPEYENENDKDFYVTKSIPIEIFLYCLLNYVPSPFNSKIKSKLTFINDDMTFPLLSGYPYIDFDLYKIIKEISFSEFLKIYILVFLEIPLIFFSENIEKLNLLLYTLYILNYPLTDTLYFSHIYSISKEEMKNGFGKELLTFRGINIKYSKELDCSEFNDLNFVFDVDNKNLIKINENKESNIIEQLLTLNFLDISQLEKELEELKKEWKKISNSESYFNINEHIHKINKKVQKIFYEFILNVLLEIYINLQFDVTDFCIKKQNINNVSNSEVLEEEKQFFEYFKRTDKFTLYFDNYVIGFEKINFFNISRLLCDEFVNLKKLNNTKKNVTDYFKIIDDLYFSKKADQLTIDDNYIYKYYKLYHELNIEKIMTNINKKKKIKLFCFDKDMINDFMYFSIHKVDDFDNKIIIPSIEKRVIAKINQKELYFSLVYIFAIIFPLFTQEECLSFLAILLGKYVGKIKFCQRYCIYILLESIYLQYKTNKENFRFSDINLESLNWCFEQIKTYLLSKKLMPNEGVLFYLKNILYDKKVIINEKIDNKDKNNERKDDVLNRNNNAIFEYEKAIMKMELNYDPVTKHENKLILLLGSNRISNKLFGKNDIHKEIYKLYSFFLENNFNADLLETKKKDIIELIANLIFIIDYKFEDKAIATYLWKTLVVYKLKKDNKEELFKKVNNKKK